MIVIHFLICNIDLLQSTLHQYLKDLSHYGAIVRDLHLFVDAAARGSTKGGIHGNRLGFVPSLTYEALASVFSQFLSDYLEEMADLQIEIARQGE